MLKKFRSFLFVKRITSKNWRFYDFIATVYEKTIGALVEEARYIKKIYDYARFLREDYDWDHSYILRLLHFKMDRTQKALQEDEYHENSQKYAREIRGLMRVLNRIVEDDYMSVETKILLDDDPLEERFEEVEKKGKTYKVFPSRSKEHMKAFKAEMKREDALRKADEKRFFDGFRKNFRNWWT